MPAACRPRTPTGHGTHVATAAAVAAGSAKESWQTDPLCLAVRNASAAGITVVVAAGNFGQSSNGQEVNGAISAPGNDPTVISVGSVNFKGAVGRGRARRRRGQQLEQVILADDAMALAQRLLDTLSAPLVINGTEVLPGASIGITFSDLGYRTADEVLRDADLAMYAAKADGRRRIALFDQSMHERIAEKLKLEGDLRRAIGDGQHVVEPA